LRRQAEERLDALSAAAPAPEELAVAVHELRVHQIELEMQNEELHRAQLELNAQRAEYLDLFDLAPVGYLTLSDKGIVGEANFTAARLLGVERRRLVRQPFSAFVFAADQDAYYLHNGLLKQTGEPQSYELRLRRAGGEAGSGAAPSHFWARLESRPRRAADGETLSSWVTFSDVDARVAATEEVRRLNDVLEERVLTRTAELAESEAKYRDVVERASDGIAILQGGLVLFANEALARMSGYSVDELAGMRFLAVVREAQHAEIAERVRLRLAGELPPTNYEIDLVRKDGTPFTVEVSAGAVTYEGAPADLVLLRDVSERKRAEEELRISEERYRLLADNANDVIWTMSLDGRITYVSPAVERMRGFTPEEAMSQPLEEIQPPDSAAITLGYFVDLGATLQAGLPPRQFRGELEYYCKDGSTVWTDVQVIP